MSALQAEVTAARAAADAARQRADEAIASFKQQYPAALQFVYPVRKYERPFFVRSVWHDGQFTYIKADAHGAARALRGEGRLAGAGELPGASTARTSCPRCIDRGYLALGKARFEFQQER